MTFGERITKLRKENGYATRKSFCEKLGIPETTLRNYETDAREPGHTFLIKISNLLNVSIDYIMGLTDEKDKIFSYQLTTSEFEKIEQYRNLDDLGKKHIDYELNRETERVTHIQELETKLTESHIRLCLYPYMRKIACAGEGFYFDDIPTEAIEAPYMEGADFIIGVNGDSMEPDYSDGDDVYVKKTDHLKLGDIGIFTIGNECFLKEYGENGLISHNKEYDDIPGTEDVRLIGKVIGKVGE